MTTVIIPYRSNDDGLAVVLTLLQLQTVLPKQIIVIDNSNNAKGTHLATQYKMNVPITCLRKHKTIYASWNAGLNNSNTDTLFINDDIMIPLDCIEQFEKAKSQTPGLCYVPLTPSIDHRQIHIIPKKFGWKSKPLNITKTGWMPGFCFYLPKTTIRKIGLFDEKFRIWYGDFDYQKRIELATKNRNIPAIILVQSLYIYHFGTLSYNLSDLLIKHTIHEDKKYFDRKYGKGTADEMLDRMLHAN